ncbi:XRE family transcriptional regulator [Verrucomicrobia bacterium]|nr:XRE family transcriptional regulator [Verrucomicrobiota bacterium]
MSTVAEQLQQARQAQNLTVHQIAEITKIRTDHLRALEEGNYEIFSAPVYIRGFVRSYSTLLKLDVPKIMAALDQELGQTKKHSEPPPFAEPAGGVLDVLMLQLSKVDWRKALVVLGTIGTLVVVLGAVLLLRHQRSADPLSGLKPALYQSPAGGSGDTLPVPSPPRR